MSFKEQMEELTFKMQDSHLANTEREGVSLALIVFTFVL